MNIEEIKAYMKKNSISQIELSQKSGIPLNTIRSIFCGRIAHPRIDTMQAIENALGLNEATSQTTANIIRDLQNAGLTEERYNTMTETQRQDLLQLIRIMTRKDS